MNIFFTDQNEHIAARNLCDQHLIKMILETAQLLCTAHRVLDGQETVEYIINEKTGKARKRKYWRLPVVGRQIDFYRATHVNHPCAIWARQSRGNYRWLYTHFHTLCDEYSFRFNKFHSTGKKLLDALASFPDNIANDDSIYLPPLAMPDKYKQESVTESYKAYMRGEKWRFGTKRIQYAKWTARDVPGFYWVEDAPYRVALMTKDGDKIWRLVPKDI